MAAHWWAPALRGVLAILFGLIALVWPGITLLALVLVFAAYAVVNGVVTLMQAARGHTGRSRAWIGVSGLISLLVGLIAFLWPGITALALLLVIAFWFVVTGIVEIVAAVGLRRRIEGEWVLALNGVVSVVFGLLLFVWPATGALAVVWLIGLSAVAIGVSLLVLAFRLRGGHRAGAAGPAHSV
ncbi:HdeD family acid-resistance protein [Microbispora sp. RL4-1S]|uniref:HdeD family acid-resistance protein n=2 Tax=Microbispora oryzae TaxID=2806554 RepID=A0A940WCV2_9ACTN|nr:HdeD family acid-resistance protein [Microbispora oryzae]